MSRIGINVYEKRIVHQVGYLQEQYAKKCRFLLFYIRKYFWKSYAAVCYKRMMIFKIHVH